MKKTLLFTNIFVVILSLGLVWGCHPARNPRGHSFGDSLCDGLWHIFLRFLADSQTG
jgi:hypothetical protein